MVRAGASVSAARHGQPRPHTPCRPAVDASRMHERTPDEMIAVRPLDGMRRPARGHSHPGSGACCRDLAQAGRRSRTPMLALRPTRLFPAGRAAHRHGPRRKRLRSPGASSPAAPDREYVVTVSRVHDSGLCATTPSPRRAGAGRCVPQRLSGSPWLNTHECDTSSNFPVVVPPPSRSGNVPDGVPRLSRHQGLRPLK